MAELDRGALLTCAELVELVTEYLEDALPAEARQRFEAHLSACPACVDWVESVRRTTAAARGVDLGAVPDHLVDDLLQAFRDFHRNR